MTSTATADTLAVEESAAPVPVIAAPRRAWRVLLLNLATLGVYPCFWLFGRARDLRTLQRETYRPWLWLLSPLAAISLCFSIPRLLTGYQSVAARVGIAPWPRSARALGVLLFAMSAIETAWGRFELPLWTLLTAVLVWSVAFAWPQAKIAEIHSRVPGVRYRGASDRYSVTEWVVLALGLPLSALVIAALLYLALLGGAGEPVGGATSPAGTSVVLDFPPEGWRQVDRGTFAEDADSEAEFAGPLLDEWLIVFAYAPSFSLDELVENRLGSLRGSLSNVSCTEKRSFVGSRLEVTVTIVCRGTWFGDPAIEVSRYLETETGTYELLGHVSASRLPFERASGRMLVIVDSFRVAP